MVGPVFDWSQGKCPGRHTPFIRSLTLTMLLCPGTADEGSARGILEGAAGQRLCSKGAVKVNSAQPMGTKELRNIPET